MVMSSNKQTFGKVLIFGAILSLLASSLIAPMASAVDAMNDLKDYKLFRALTRCTYEVNNSILSGYEYPSDSQLSSGSWYNNSIPGMNFVVKTGFYVDGSDGKQECNTVLSGVKTAWGYGSYSDMASSFKMTRNSGGNWEFPQNAVTEMRNGLDAKKRLPSYKAEYIWFDAFTNFTKQTDCEAKKVHDGDPQGAEASMDSMQKIWNVIDGKLVAETWQFKPNSDVNYGASTIKVIEDGDFVGSCKTVAGLLSWDNANNYANFYKTLPADSKPVVGSSSGGENADGDKGKSTCNVDGIGWTVCPVMNFLGGLMDKMVAYLGDTFLKTNSDLVKADDSNGTYVAWKIFRNYANIAFIIAFLFVIYSQITGAGASNYGLKRMLPRLIVSAILVNVSFIICQLAVDISNALGYGVTGLFNSVIQQVGGASPNLAGTDSGSAWAEAIGGANGVLLAGVGVALALALGILIPALLAVLLVVIILLARQAVIVLLIVAAPLAFVAYLLPNTEDWFKKWYKMFFNLLMVFPIIAAVFGASKLAATIIDSIGNSQDPDGGATSLRLMALGITVIPFFVVPSLLKGAMSATGALGAKLQGYGDRATGRAGAKAGAKAKERWGNTSFARGSAARKQLKQQHTDRRYAEKLGGDGWRGRMTRIGARGMTPLTRKIPGMSGSAQAQYDGLARSAYGAAKEADSKDVNFAAQKMSDDAISNGGTEYLKKQFSAAVQRGDTVAARAAVQAMKGQGDGGIDALHQSLSAYDKSESKSDAMSNSLKGFISNQHSDIKEKDARITGWAGGTSGIDDSNVVGGLSDRHIASQTKSALDAAVNSGSLKQPVAQRVIKAADEGNIDLKGGQRTALESAKP